MGSSPCSGPETPEPPTHLSQGGTVSEQLYVYVTELNKTTLFLISPQPECVFIFFVSFIQTVQEPNKLYFLNLPSFCSVSFIKPPEGGPRRRLVGGEKQQDSSTPPCYYCILALGKVGGSLPERGGPVTSHCPGPSLSAVCALKCWQSYFCSFLGPCPVSC